MCTALPTTAAGETDRNPNTQPNCLHLQLVSEVEQVKTNLIIQMEILGRWLAIIVVLIAIGALLLAFLHAHEPFAEAFKSAVAIAVAMIPEGRWTGVGTAVCMRADRLANLQSSLGVPD